MKILMNIIKTVGVGIKNFKMALKTVREKVKKLFIVVDAFVNPSTCIRGRVIVVDAFVNPRGRTIFRNGMERNESK